MAELKALIGQRIAEARLKLGLTQEELAERVGLAAENLSRAERGKALLKVNKLVAVADVLGVSIDDLARGREIAPRPVETPRRGRAVTRLVQKIEALDDETAAQVAKLLTVLLSVIGNRKQ
jgi:transcriptional regulator with XRE-family HTH domain